MNAECKFFLVVYLFLHFLKRTFNLLSVLNTVILIINLIVLFKTERIVVFKDEWWVLYNVQYWTMFSIVYFLLATNRKFLPDAWFRKTTIELPCSFPGLFFVCWLTWFLYGLVLPAQAKMVSAVHVVWLKLSILI